MLRCGNLSKNGASFPIERPTPNLDRRKPCLLQLTEAQYAAGRKDLDSVDHARMDRETAEAELEKLASARALAQWQAARALFPQQFPVALMRQLHLEVRLPSGSENP